MMPLYVFIVTVVGLLVVYKFLQWWRENFISDEIRRFLRMMHFGGQPQKPCREAANVIGVAEIERVFPVLHVCAAERCAVCLSPIEEGESSRQLQCAHIFHADCVLSWWQHAKKDVLECPLCRHEQKMDLSQDNEYELQVRVESLPDETVRLGTDVSFAAQASRSEELEASQRTQTSPSPSPSPSICSCQVRQ